MRTFLKHLVDPYNLVLVGVLFGSLVVAIYYYSDPVPVRSARTEASTSTQPDVLKEEVCIERTYVTSTRNIILRVDDIQAFAWTDIARRMIDDAEAHNVPLSLAVIPIGLPEDRAIVNFLHNNRCHLEFGIHGWDNQEPTPTVGEFALLDKAEARSRLEKGLSVLDRITTDEKPITFVPPNNQLSDGSREALAELGFKIISSEGDGRYDFDTTTFDFVTDTLVPVSRVEAECVAAFKSGEEECVVMLHPQDFATDGTLDEKKYQLFLDMLDVLKKRGYSFVRFEDTL